MKRLKKISLAILGGIDVTFYIFTPIIIASLWVSISKSNDWTTAFIYAIGLLSTLFRAIKIGWMK